MAQVQEIGNAQGDLERWPPYSLLGLGRTVRLTAPTNGQPGFAPQCEWIQYFSSGYAIRYVNEGSATTSFWVESDSGPGTGIIFGQSGGAVTSTGLTMLASGNVARDIQNAAGKSPSATSADKILYALWVPANSFDVAGRGLVVTVYGTLANGTTKTFKVILGATNTTFPTLPAVDGTVTVSGGTAIGTTGNQTGAGPAILTCQIFKRGAAGSNTQESMTTGIIINNAHAGAGSWTDQTFTESSNLLLVVTGSNGTTTTDTVYNGSEVTAFN